MDTGITQFARSADLFQTSKQWLAGGVSSGMRSSAKPLPLFFESASASRMKDVDGNEYIDYALGWGPLILGHCHPAITAAVSRQLRAAHLFGAQSQLEILVAEQVCRMVPSAELVAFSNTGSEAVQVAFRLARAFTGKQKIVRFAGHYHGWLDNVLYGYRPTPGSDGRTPIAPSGGMAERAREETCILPWNSLEEVEALLKRPGAEIAAIITEPILCNSGCLMPRPGYLEGLRELASQFGVVLIFDEVITGFRVARGGAQELFGVTPDLAVFGKAVAGGFPLSVIAGRKDILELIATHRVVHAGTFNGNPISLAAAHATLQALSADDGAAFHRIRETGEELITGIRRLAKEAGIPVLVNGVGAAFSIGFTQRREMRNLQEALEADTHARDEFLGAMLQSGIHLLPDGRWYVSAVHTQEDVGRTLEAVKQVFAAHRSRLKSEMVGTAAPAADLGNSPFG